jgi:hypothetical protein
MKTNHRPQPKSLDTVGAFFCLPMRLAHLSRSSLFAGVPPGHYADKLNGRYTTLKQAAPLAEFFGARKSCARPPSETFQVTWKGGARM